VEDPETLARIRALAIPPAWRETWICPDPQGHIQAVGTDAAGRRQYRCHDRWRARRDQAKFEHMIEFGRALPHLRERASAHLVLRGFPKERILVARLAWPGKRSQSR
jgi:DNA topoisomerase-1